MPIELKAAFVIAIVGLLFYLFDKWVLTPTMKANKVEVVYEDYVIDPHDPTLLHFNQKKINKYY